MIRVGICDDDCRVPEQVKQRLVQYSIEQDVELTVKSFSQGEELLEYTEELDLLFLDILFPGGITGLDVAKKLRLRGVKVPIVFLSNSDGYALEGYKVSAERYLLKPLSQDDISAVMDKLLAKHQLNRYHLMIHSNHGLAMVHIPDILYIDCRARKRWVHIKGTRIETWEPLRELLSQLPQKQFAHTHKSIVVNIDRMSWLGRNDVKMENGDWVPLARHYKDGFKNACSQFAQGY